MFRRIIVSIVVAALALWGADSAFAAGKGRGGGNPPGWSKGKKKGWKGGSEPPGWSKRGGKSGKAKKSKEDERGSDSSEGKKETAQEKSEEILKEVGERILRELGSGAGKKK